jgi:hypothetical protein
MWPIRIRCSEVWISTGHPGIYMCILKFQKIKLPLHLLESNYYAITRITECMYMCTELHTSSACMSR